MERALVATILLVRARETWRVVFTCDWLTFRIGMHLHMVESALDLDVLDGKCFSVLHSIRNLAEVVQQAFRQFLCSRMR